ncbi:class I SAM-dependent methyltransferase [Planktothrix sp. FACHB-1355]|uniref:Class I SAM-dependent methyltransferase n=1 Tax=Aerosakkonema funiforme FACHB-1375 TaxID=2949571 RepID=A0A926VJE7_9CYAN|nr:MULTISPECIES: class I SAM-dependent methyltransferase [Oscillatoriales]MBD2183822.1 class I SAM-dependent methyltransferase [Aerosakkonema funiforme FACHB-1375]MBD3558285.1 class I SAM-dependent methyltransferase [Planktothrix sp. FACHB-1355]
MNQYDFTGVEEWNRIEGWFDLSEAIAIQKFVKQLPPGANLVELGSYKGRSGVAIASVLPPNGVLYCVDHFQGSEEHKKSNIDTSNLLETFTKNIERFGVKDKIYTLQMSATEASKKFEPESIDPILLDAAHDYDSVKADLLNWYPKLKPGGYLFCDDYAPNWPGVMRAIETVGLEGKVIAASLWMHNKPVGSV